MKLRPFVLAIAILLCAVIVASAGAYMKYHILKPMELYQDKSIFELPFLMYGDEYLRFMVENAEEMKQMEQENPVTTAPPTSSAPPETTVPPTTSTAPSTAPADSENPTTSAPDDTTESTQAPTDSTSQPPETTTQPPETTTQAPTTTQPPTTTVPPTTQPPATQPSFDFPEGMEESWFDDALFIGDSRVVGLREYARLGNADYFCDVGMTVLTYKNKVMSDHNFSNLSLEELLESRQYGKIIVNFGLNECGYNDYSFKMLYSNLVALLKEKQPDAIIILQGIMSVTRSKASTADFFHPSFIAARSDYIESLADGQSVFYIDCNAYFSDSEGYLYSSITNDGYHPTVAGYRYWRDWISFAIKELGLSS